MDNSFKAYLQLHTAVFLYGLAAILGKLIELDALFLVWWRVVITSLSLVILIHLGSSTSLRIKRSDLKFVFIGILVALHWVAFYGSIKMGNASIALVGMATTSLFTAMIKPLISKTAFVIRELAFGIIVIPAMMLIASGLDADMMWGFMVGILAALIAAVFAVLNKIHVNAESPSKITFIEMSSAVIFLSTLLPFFLTKSNIDAVIPARGIDWIYLMVLSLLCTTFTFILSLKALKHLRVPLQVILFLI